MVGRVRRVVSGASDGGEWGDRCAATKRQASQVVLVVKNPPANAEDIRDLGGFDPWVGKIPGGGHGNPLQYSCLENPMDRGAWQATVHRVTNSRT